MWRRWGCERLCDPSRQDDALYRLRGLPSISIRLALVVLEASEMCGSGLCGMKVKALLKRMGW